MIVQLFLCIFLQSSLAGNSSGGSFANGEPDFRFFSSGSLEEQNEGDPTDPDNPIDPDEPYIVYGNDESDSFTDAVTVSLYNDPIHPNNIGGSISGYINDIGDLDYYLISSQSSLLYLSFACSKNLDFEIYKQMGTSWFFMMDLPLISTSDTVIIEPGSDYCFSVRANDFLTGRYAITISEKTINESDSYIHIEYSSLTGTFSKYELLSFDFSDLSDSGSLICSNPNPLGFSETYLSTIGGSDTVRQFYNDWDTPGIYDSNGNYSVGYYPSDPRALRNFYIDPGDDDRRELPSNSYPSTATAFTYGRLRKFDTSVNPVEGSSFFVSPSFAITAAHMLVGLRSDLGVYIDRLALLPACDCTFDGENGSFVESELPLTNGKYSVSDAFFPLKYLVNAFANTSKPDYDWAILKIGEKVSPQSGHGRSYVGLKYGSNVSSLPLISIGYPSNYYNDVCDEHCLAPKWAPTYVKNLSSQGIMDSIYARTFVTTKIDLSPGNSGGPLLDTSASYPYAVGLTSGNNGSGNVFTRIVKETVGLVGELL